MKFKGLQQSLVQLPVQFLEVETESQQFIEKNNTPYSVNFSRASKGKYVTVDDLSFDDKTGKVVCKQRQVEHDYREPSYKVTASLHFADWVTTGFDQRVTCNIVVYAEGLEKEIIATCKADNDYRRDGEQINRGSYTVDPTVVIGIIDGKKYPSDFKVGVEVSKEHSKDVDYKLTLNRANMLVQLFSNNESLPGDVVGRGALFGTLDHPIYVSRGGEGTNVMSSPDFTMKVDTLKQFIRSTGAVFPFKKAYDFSWWRIDMEYGGQSVDTTFNVGEKAISIYVKSYTSPQETLPNNGRGGPSTIPAIYTREFDVYVPSRISEHKDGKKTVGCPTTFWGASSAVMSVFPYGTLQVYVRGGLTSSDVKLNHFNVTLTDVSTQEE